MWCDSTAVVCFVWDTACCVRSYIGIVFSSSWISHHGLTLLFELLQGTVPGSHDGLGRVSYEHSGECFFIPFAQEDILDPSMKLKTGDQVIFHLAADAQWVQGVIRGVGLLDVCKGYMEWWLFLGWRFTWWLIYSEYMEWRLSVGWCFTWRLIYSEYMEWRLSLGWHFTWWLIYNEYMEWWLSLGWRFTWRLIYSEYMEWRLSWGWCFTWWLIYSEYMEWRLSLVWCFTWQLIYSENMEWGLSLGWWFTWQLIYGKYKEWRLSWGWCFTWRLMYGEQEGMEAFTRVVFYLVADLQWVHGVEEFIGVVFCQAVDWLWLWEVGEFIGVVFCLAVAWLGLWEVGEFISVAYMWIHTGVREAKTCIRTVFLRGFLHLRVSKHWPCRPISLANTKTVCCLRESFSHSLFIFSLCLTLQLLIFCLHLAIYCLETLGCMFVDTVEWCEWTCCFHQKYCVTGLLVKKPLPSAECQDCDKY